MPFDGLADSAVGDGEKPDLAFRNHGLKQFIRGKSQFHSFRVGPNEDVIGFEDEIDGVDCEGLLFLGRKGRNGNLRRVAG